MSQKIARAALNPDTLIANHSHTTSKVTIRLNSHLSGDHLADALNFRIPSLVELGTVTQVNVSQVTRTVFIPQSILDMRTMRNAERKAEFYQDNAPSDPRD